MSELYSSENKVLVVDKLSEKETEDLWREYNRSFEEMQTLSPTLQIMTREDFDPAMKDPKVNKLLIKNGDTIESALIYSKINVSDKYFPWISLKYFEHNWPEKFSEENIYYFVGLFSTPESSGLGNVYALRDKLFEKVENESPNGAMFVYDCCDHNKGLAEMLHFMAEDYMENVSSNPWSVDTLNNMGSQTFYSIDMKSN